MTRLGEEALKAEPGNEPALRGLIKVRLGQQSYDEALALLDRLSKNTSLSPGGHADRAAALLTVAEASGRDAVPLLGRARADYQQAIALDAENLEYWTGLAEVIARQEDTAAANDLKQKATRLYNQHPRTARLARALAFMCVATGDPDTGLKLALAWQDNALTDQDHDAAAAYVSRLRTNIERRDAMTSKAQ